MQARVQEARERQAQADDHLRQAQAPLREAFQLESEARRLERTLAERQALHRQSNQRHAQQSDAARQLDMEQQRHVAEQAQLQAALRDSQALAALGDAWATHQGQLAAFVQRRQRALESQAQLPELEKSLAQAGEPLERLQAQWTALHGSEPDDLAARLDELRRQTDSLERQQALHKEWQQALDQRTGLARRLGELDQRMVEQEQALLDLKRQGSQYAEEVKAAEQALEVTRELLQRQRLARSASVEQLRAGLVDGEACPVCGSQEHPYHHSEQLLAALGEHDDQEQVRAEQSLERLRQTLVGLREGYSSQRERLNQSRQEQQELTGHLAALDRQLEQWTLPEELRLLQPSAQLEWLAQRLDDLAGQRQQRQRDFDRLIARQRQTQQLQQELRAAETSLQQRQQALTEQRQRYEHLQQQVEEDSQQLRPLLSDEHWQRWQADPLRTFQALGESIEQRRQQQARLQQVEQRLQELKQRCDESSWQLKQSDEQRNEARQAEERVQAELAELNGRLGAHLGQHACAQDWQLSLEHAAQAARALSRRSRRPWIRCARNNCDSPKPWNTCSSNGSANRMSSSACRPTGRPGANARTTSTTAASTPCSAFPRNRRRNGGSNCSDCKRRSPASRRWKRSARRNCSSIAGSGRKPTARRWKTTCGNSANAWPPANRPTWIPTASCRPTTSAASRARRCLPSWSEPAPSSVDGAA
ncbi:SMC family ATPase [Pseudomonas aeruginosa]|nr:SMC family ATPase [Pseudomonas aeruginosa]